MSIVLAEDEVHSPRRWSLEAIFGPWWIIKHTPIQNGVNDRLLFWHKVLSFRYGPQVFQTVPIMWPVDHFYTQTCIAVRPVMGGLFRHLGITLLPYEGIGVSFWVRPYKGGEYEKYHVLLWPCSRRRPFAGTDYYFGNAIHVGPLQPIG